MMQVANQFRRIFSDNGSGDKDFSEQEAKLREVHKKLRQATDLLTQVSQTLAGLIQAKGLH